MTERRKPTSTSNFGVGRRENHDASDFYDRFTPPDLTLDDNDIHPDKAIDRVICGDARKMTDVPDASVALVVTSPPYFAGKEYEQALGEGHIPATYLEYLTMLEDVFAECVRTLEPGGRIAVNVANLGRKPYRSLAADVIRILQDELKLLLRGEIIWSKADGAGGSCAWGSFQSAANPVLRDLTERVVIASKGRFDRALSRRKRAARDLPSEGSIFRDDFMEATTDLWRNIPPESATRVGHPAPFPVALPQRLIDLYTYRGDLVLDPFMGSGTTAVAAVRGDRHYVGYDTDEQYVAVAEARVRAEREALAATRERREARRVELPAIPAAAEEDEPFQARAVREGQKAKEIARAVLTDCGFDDFEEDLRLRSGVEVNFTARDRRGELWYFDISGAFTTSRAGLRRTDTLWKALGKAAVLRAELGMLPRLILLSTDLPAQGSAGWAALSKARREVYCDAIEMLSAEGQDRLQRYADGEGDGQPLGELIPPTGDDR